jgi:hypothetical protein
MKKKNVELVLGLFIIVVFTLTATFVFAQDTKDPIKRSYKLDDKYDAKTTSEKDLSIVSSVTKTVSTSKKDTSYELQVLNGNVVLINLSDGTKRSVYSKGDAIGLSEVDLYYYDTQYILVLTESGDVYANVYKSNEENVRFRLVSKGSDVKKIKVLETNHYFYEYPSVEIYGVTENNNWELIKL